MAESLKYFIPKYLAENRYDKVKFIVFFSFLVQILTSIIVLLFLFFGAEYIAVHYFRNEAAFEVLKVFSFYFVFLCISQTLENFFIAIQDTFAHKMVEFLRSTFTMLYVVFVFFLGYSSMLNFSYGWIFGLALATFISL
ncbi:MAG: hypothetical protein LBF15_03360 [Candidatus Peribacteria bacterium]|jgi:Na+-driven multidrug efflux pump|nr:hypothetical protein [Candidatus Peribacteria bacterium]